MDLGAGEQSEGRGRGRSRSRGRGRGMANPVAVGARQPTMRSGDINRLNKTTHLYGAVDFQMYACWDYSGTADARAPTRQCCCTTSTFDYAIRTRCRFWGLLSVRNFDINSGLLCLRREMEAGITHVPSAIRRGNYHTIGCRIPLGVTDGRQACWRLREGLPVVVWEIDMADGSEHLAGEARAQRGGGSLLNATSC
ncbi:hypothetical protein PIB30_011128 [Stylosanthes scabra]|uniref:Uncharacterized protein n=1 Tax=Stylosanthes scabra TaxID=79078 RepID=A0ABU6Q6F4_9FABA|nr:hypothetical protein [Stylosanthes scabra]